MSKSITATSTNDTITIEDMYTKTMLSITSHIPVRGIDYDDYPREKEKLPQNCKNCGAPLRSHECEYCGTRY